MAIKVDGRIVKFSVSDESGREKGAENEAPRTAAADARPATDATPQDTPPKGAAPERDAPASAAPESASSGRRAAPESGSARSSGLRPSADVIQMHEQLERPEELIGATYKIKTPLSEHALYVTINDIVLNPGTEHELRRPFEIFINSKNMEHFQWIVALTRIISAVFRKGGDVAFLVEELHSVFDPGGGYLKRGGKRVPSLVAEIGTVVEEHLIKLGLMQRDEPDENQRRHIDEIRRKLGCEGDDFPPDSVICARCSTKAAVMLEGCLTCLNCGDSKCG